VKTPSHPPAGSTPRRGSPTSSRRTRPRLGGIAGLLLALLFSSLNPAQAQDRSFPYSLGKQDLVLLPLGLGMVSLGSSLGDATDPITREEISRLHQSDVNGFDRSATDNWSPAWGGRSDEYRDWLVRGAFLFLGAEGVNALAHRRFAEVATLGVMFGELYLFTAGATYMTKAIVGRKRPYVFNPDMSVDERFHIASSDGNEVFFSFFSGHASAAFATAAFASTLFMDIHGKSVWSHLVWGSTLTFAALTGYSRVKAGVHYPSDVIVGAMVGSAIGHLVPRLHRKGAEGRVSLLASPTSIGVRLRF